MRNLFFLIVFLEAFGISVILIPVVIRLALKWKVVDQPGERKVHHKPKPLLGGAGIFWSFVLVIVGNLLLLHFLGDAGWVQIHFPSLSRWRPMLSQIMPKLILILSAGFLMHLFGVLDDLFKEKMTYHPKFIVQIVIAFIVALLGIRVDFMPHPALDILVTVFWIVGITNSFNLLDNMDGLTGGVSAICGILLFCIALLQGQIFFAFMLITLTGACLGFLIYNFNPSKIFMGDGGSLFLGFIFGTLTITGSYVVPTSGSLMPVAIPVLILSIPLYDTFSVIFIRWREKRPLFIGDKKHFSHRLVELGMSHRNAVLFIYLVCFCVGIPAILLPYLSVGASLLVLTQAVIIYTLITILIAIGKQNQTKKSPV